MKKLTHLIGTLAVLALSITLAQAQQTQDRTDSLTTSNFIKLNEKATFIHGTDVVLTIPNPDDYSLTAQAKTVDERANALTAIRVDRDGNLYEATISAQDLAIFENAIAQFEKISRSGALMHQPGHPPLQEPFDATDSMIDIQRVIGGSDERVRITNTTQSPYWFIGRIDVGCTGTLIGPRHVLTAGHCVSDGNGNFFSALDFTAAQNGSTAPWGKESWANVTTTSAWHNGRDSSGDYALITLQDAPHGGWNGYGTYSGGVHRVTGYPGDKPRGTMWTDSSTTTSTSTAIRYTLDTAGGQSGSGVMDTGNTIRGIHTLGGFSFNSGVRITSNVFNTIQGWVNDNP